MLNSYLKQMTQQNPEGPEFLRVSVFEESCSPVKKRTSHVKNGAADRIQQLNLKKEISNDLDELQKLFSKQKPDELLLAVSPDNCKRGFMAATPNRKRRGTNKW